jgi:tRNA pseudouridine55 synthase
LTSVGLLLVDKPEGPTSHDVVDVVRRAVGVRRVGHTGTLDPFASGLLLLCVGWATRLAEYLTALPKTYRGIVRLGQQTDTDDRLGTIVSESESWNAVTADQVRSALDEQLGDIEQMPPAYSAKKVAGQRAYDVARKGEAPALSAEAVTVHRLVLRDYSPPDVSIEIECSSGTYIRSIARDVGARLGTGGHLRSLRRQRIGQFDVAEAVPLDDESMSERIVASLRPPEEAVAHLATAVLDATAGSALSHGRSVEWGQYKVDEPVAVIVEGNLVAIAESREGQLWPHKVFAG